MFHVKPLQGECSAHTCMGITEHQEVRHKVSKQSIARVATGCLHTGITEHETVRL